MDECKSVLELLNVNVSNGKLSTGSQSLDKTLRGGIEYGKITELYGEAGAGKTQLILQLAVNLAARDVDAVIIDTEGKLCTERLLEISNSATNSGPQLLDRILVRRCRNQEELLATVLLLPALLQTKKKVKGVFIDSVAHPFRYTEETEDLNNNAGLLYRLCETLNDIASMNNIAVVVTNQVTTSLDSGTGFLVPALGEAWRHAVPTRIQLKHPHFKDKDDDYEPGLRIAIPEKSSCCAPAEAKFMIRSAGIGDI